MRVSNFNIYTRMSADSNAEMPLYMESIMAVLRSMQDNFDYAAFRSALTSQGFNRSQTAVFRPYPLPC